MKNLFTPLAAGFTMLLGSIHISSSSKTKFIMNTATNETVSIITVTKVATPWYATRSAVVKRFVAAIPDYQKIPGLLSKSFALSSGGGYFGGVYYWRSKQAAEQWFNDAWFEAVKKKYKTSGEVFYYSVTGEQVISPVTTGKDKYWSVISIGSTTINVKAQGLLKVTFIKDEKGTDGHLSLWKTEKEALDFYKNNISANEFLDTPVLLINNNE